MKGDMPKASIKFIRHQLELLSVSCATRRRYDPALIRWCLMINFHSPAAYRSMLLSNHLLLPSERLLRTYTSPLTVTTGLSNERESYFSTAASSLNKLQKNVALIVDEMYIKSEVSYGSGKLHGFADNSNDTVPATTMLTIIVQSLCGNYRDVVAFFPVKCLTGDDQTRYLKEAIFVLEHVGFSVCCIICDNSKVNRVTMKNFAVVIDGDNVVVDPKHPVDSNRNIVFIIDPCHLLKCIRNNWLNKGLFKIENADVSFDLIKRLFKEDQKRTVKLAPQLTVKVVSPTSTERQCVRYAAALFSPAISSALEVYASSDHQLFNNADSVVQFLKRINQFWCWSNIQNLQQVRNSRDPDQQPF